MANGKRLAGLAENGTRYSGVISLLVLLGALGTLGAPMLNDISELKAALRIHEEKGPDHPQGIMGRIDALVIRFDELKETIKAHEAKGPNHPELEVRIRDRFDNLRARLAACQGDTEENRDVLDIHLLNPTLHHTGFETVRKELGQRLAELQARITVLEQTDRRYGPRLD
jgi:hypothetical protein